MSSGKERDAESGLDFTGKDFHLGGWHTDNLGWPIHDGFIVMDGDAGILASSLTTHSLRHLASGAGNAYPYSVVIADTAGLSAPSFSASPASGNLQGATGGGSGQTIYSYCVSGPSNTCSPANSGYDPVGNLLGYSDSVMGTWNFGYDSLNRLLSGTPATGNNSNNGLSLCWSYDSFGNRTSGTHIFDAQGVASGDTGAMLHIFTEIHAYSSSIDAARYLGWGSIGPHGGTPFWSSSWSATDQQTRPIGEIFNFLQHSPLYQGSNWTTAYRKPE